MAYQALYRKWRPRTFDDVVGQQHITETLKRQVETDRLSHAYLFVGTRGTGKTTCAKILSRAVNCEYPVNGNPCNACAACRGIEDGSVLEVEEIDAASNNGVDNVRALRDEAIYSPAAVRKRVYIIDEVHMLSASAFNALLKILEEPPEHLMFILATTELHKVPATILSRCQRFNFKRIMPEDIIGRLKQVAEAEQISLTDGGAAMLARLADGGMRDALSLLDQCGGDVVDEQRILSAIGLTGSREILALYHDICSEDMQKALLQVDDLYRNGKDMNALLSELQALIRDLLLYKVAGKASAQLLSGRFSGEELAAAAKGVSPQQAMTQLELLREASENRTGTKAVRLTVELCIMRLCSARLRTDSDSLADRVAALEQRLDSGDFAPAGRPVPEAVPMVEQPQPAKQEKASARQSAPAAPAEEEGPPPWDDSDVPPEPDRFMPPPPPPFAEKPKRENPVPAPRSAEPARTPVKTVRPAAAKASGGDDAWKKVLEILGRTADPPTVIMLSDAENCAGYISAGRFLIYCSNPFIQMMVEQEETMPLIRKAVEEAFGAMPVSTTDQLPPSKASAAPAVPSLDEGGPDPLDELKKFDIIDWK